MAKLVIPTELNTDKFERQLTDLQRKADKKQIDIDITSKNVQNLKEEIKRAKEESDAYFNKYEKLVAEQGRYLELKHMDPDIMTAEETNEFVTGTFRHFDRELEELDKQMAKSTVGNFEKLTEELEKQEQKLQDQRYEYEKIIGKINEIKQKQEDVSKTQLSNIGSSIGNITKKVAKWGLAVFGIRSIYFGIRNAINVIAQQDEQLANTINYIKFALAVSIKPIVEWIVNTVYKILSIFGGIIKAITGINIFSKATASNFAKANSNAGALRKTLAGFDEMNVINESGGTGLLGGLLGSVPDLASQVEQQASKIKEWFTKGLPTREELENNAQTYKNAWINVGKFLGLGTFFNDFKMMLNELEEQLKPMWQPITDTFNYTIEQIKLLFKPFTDYIDNNLLNPIKTKATEWKDGFLSRYAKFINKLIYGANYFLQYFGIQLEYIDEESAITGEDIKENIGNAMQDVKEDSDKTANSLGTLWQKLKDLTSKGWNIVTNFTTNGLSKSTMNNWLQPLRDNLAKLGINLPYLAKGGIINMPGKGVPVGGAIGGERGQEGVIPLTDSQQMELLGETIGRYVNIQANIPVYVGNRMVARELKRINAEDNFAYNR